MCLGMPGEIVEIMSDHPDLATVDMNGSRLVINVGLLDDDPPAQGDWVLVHLGFAMRGLSQEDAKAALEMLGVDTELEEEHAHDG